jgi:para-nitrobenzyl esterase
MATEFGFSAPQLGSIRADLVLGPSVPGDEDCLYLNVWTPSLRPRRARPVLVWLHGGAFVNGSGDVPALRGGALAAAADVVVVTVNYRLGALGFAWHPDLDAPANLGLLDQRAALTWVSQNIERFGGDPHRVTLGGDSAGAMAAALHAVSPAADGLFDRLTLHSGTPAPTDSSTLAERVGRLAAHLDVAVPDLRAVPVAALLAAAAALGPHGRLGPTASGDWAEDLSALQARARPRPTVVNTTADEGSFLLVDPSSPQELTSDQAQALAGTLLGRPELDPALGGSPRLQLVTAVTQRLFAEPADTWATRATSAGSPVWRTTYTRPATLWDGWLGATHTLDVPVLFGTHRASALARLYAADADLDAVSQDLQATWAGFLHAGSPTPPRGQHWAAWPLLTHSTGTPYAPAHDVPGGRP